MKLFLNVYCDTLRIIGKNTIIMHCMANNCPSCGPTRSNYIFIIFHTVTTFHQWNTFSIEPL